MSKIFFFFSVMDSVELDDFFVSSMLCKTRMAGFLPWNTKVEVRQNESQLPFIFFIK